MARTPTDCQKPHRHCRPFRHPRERGAVLCMRAVEGLVVRLDIGFAGDRERAIATHARRFVCAHPNRQSRAAAARWPKRRLYCRFGICDAVSERRLPGGVYRIYAGAKFSNRRSVLMCLVRIPRGCPDGDAPGAIPRPTCALWTRGRWPIPSINAAAHSTLNV